MSSPTDSDKQWVVVQLSPTGEREKNLKSLEKAITRSLKSPLMVFIPAASQKAREDEQTIFYLDGYIFVEFKPNVPYHKLNGTHFFELVLSHRRTGLQLLKDKDLQPLRNGVEALKASHFMVGDDVKVLKGTFKNLSGTVSFIYENGETVQINLKLSSKPVLIDYPSSYLVKNQ